MHINGKSRQKAGCRNFHCTRTGAGDETNALIIKALGSTFRLAAGSMGLTRNCGETVPGVLGKAMGQGTAIVREPNPADRRRSPRLHLQIPIFVRGVDLQEEEFIDLTKTVNISAVGACLASPRPLGMHQFVTLCIPAPSSPVTGLAPEAPTAISARVIRCRTAGDTHLVGLEFMNPLD